MRSKLTLMLTPILVLCMSLTFGQGKTISGNVTDQDGLPLPGVSIVVVGTTNGTQTDFDGNYSISAATGQVLRFTYLGQKTVDRTVDSSNSINVQMLEDAQSLQEVVVQGYRTGTKEKSSISTVTIAAETINDRPNASIVNTLSGQVAGLNIFASSGQPGSNAVVNLRGVSSINGDTEPLFIIDGAPVDQDNFRSLNPNEIASVTVLKDAGATAIYGNRGANGVVVIKTKRGSFNQGLQINYTGILSFGNLQDNDYDLLNSQQQLGLERLQGNGLGATLSDAEIAAFGTTDWPDFFFNTGVTENHTLTLSSGTENLSSFVSLGFFDQEGILQSSGLKRFNIRSNINGKSNNDKLNYGLNLSLNYSENDEPNNIGGGGINRNLILGAYQSVPYLSPEDYTTGADLLAPLLFSNTPLFLIDILETFTRTEDELRIIGSFNVNYKINDWLSVNSVSSGDYSDEVLLRAEAPNSFNALLFGGAANPTGGFQEEDFRRTFSFNQVTSLTYNDTFGKHSLEVGAYTEYFKAHFKLIEFLNNGLNLSTFDPGDGASFVDDNANNDLFVDNVNSDQLESGLFSYFGVVDYDYDSRYGFAATLRRDASSRFAESNRYGTFWSVSGRWNINNESFMDGSIFNLLKLRASYGTAGNQNIAGGGLFTGLDLTRDLFATNTGFASQNSLSLAQIGNNTLQWETVTSTNIGVDFEVFDRRLRGTFEVYLRETSDLFQNTPVSAITGVNNLSSNIGDLENQGVDVTLNYDLLRGGANGVNLTLNLVGNYNETELLEIPTEDGQVINGLTRNAEGGRLNEYFLVRYAGVNPANGNLLFLDADGNLTENPNVDTDRVGLDQNAFPDAQGSVGFDLDYKGFFLTTQFQYIIGVDQIDFDLDGFLNADNIGQFRNSADLLRAWTPDNRITDIPALNASNRALDGSSDRFLQSADFLRLRFASIGYSFPAKSLENTGLTRLRIFGNGENIFTLTEWRGFDPEVAGSRQFPTPRQFSLGIEVGF